MTTYLENLGTTTAIAQMETSNPYKPSVDPQPVGGNHNSMVPALLSGFMVSVLIAVVATPAEALSVISCFLGLFFCTFAGAFFVKRKFVHFTAVSVVALTLILTFVLPSLLFVQKVVIVGGGILNIWLGRIAFKIPRAQKRPKCE